MKTSIQRSFIAVIALTIAAALGCSEEKGISDEPSINKDNAPAERNSAPAAQSNTAAEGVNYFADARSVPTKLQVKIGGPVRLLELIVYPEYVKAQIQDPKKRENADDYMLRDGDVGDGVPIKFVGDAPSADDLDAATFDITSIDFAALPRMAKDATAQLKIDDGKVTHAILKRNRPFSNDVQWRIYVDGTRRDGSVVYDAAGTMKKVFK